MRSRVNVAVLLGFLTGLSAAFLMASRNGAGTYSLPAGNPVTSGTTISSTWANNTLSDIGTELTNSLDRSGRGAMTAPLQLASGNAAAPSLTFSAETNSGLFRNGSSDVRLSIAGSAVQQWGSTASTINRNLTVTTTGSGSGITVTGGSSSGAGLTATGGASNGVGIIGAGTGTGAGGTFTGGTSASVALTSTSTATNGNGLLGTGTGTGHGVIGLALDAGVPGAAFGFGGAFSGPAGIYAISTPGGVGAYLAAGTAATGGTRQDAVIIQNGDINLDQVTAPSSSTALKNRLTPANLVKAFATINSLSGTGAQTINSGFSMTSATGAASPGNQITFTLAQAMSGTSYTVLATTGVSCTAHIVSRTTTTFVVALTDVPGGGTNCTGTANAWTGTPLSVLVIGLQ